MADYVRVMIAIAAQWRVLQAIGPTASALVGVPVSQSPVAALGRKAKPAATGAAPRPSQTKTKKGGSGMGR